MNADPDPQPCRLVIEKDLYPGLKKDRIRAEPISTGSATLVLIHSIPCFVKLIDLPVVNTAQFMNIPAWSRASLNDLNTIKLLIICITCEYAQCMCGVCNSNVLITCISAADP